ncbi:hypothetical protein [Yinghuangia soli]|uniref:Uncharacterized protein n=1 Tax=Yinghuangia soli TaxID=2908204 RepID=A0AA41U081_9ACTN|nr:hypothetical protein [Yinghuangia soli]MCF2528105.1 hypothetical protein [Yinghuangia soli]
MSGGAEMRAQGLRGTVALLAFLALIVGAAMFGGCGLIGKGRTANTGNETPAAPATGTGTASRPPVSVPPAQPIPRGSGTPTVPLPRLDQVPQSDPTAVSAAAVTVLYTYDTTTDTTAQDAAVRAEPWFTSQFAASQREHVAVAPPGAEWTTWTAHKAYTAPVVEAGRDPAPGDTPSKAFRQWLVRYTPTGRDGWKGETVTVVVFVTLSRAIPSDPWRVSDLRGT